MRPFYTLYNKILEWSSSRFAVIWLATISFLESSILPWPIQDFLLASMSLKNRSKAFYFAAICTIASVLGGIAGYYIGVYAIVKIGPILANLGYESKIELLKSYFETWDIWFILVAGFSPIPYKLFTITAGILGMSIFPFIALSLISRGARYFLISYLVRKFGKRCDAWLNKYIDRLGYVLIVIVVLGIWYAY